MVALGDIIKGILFFIFVQTESSFLRFLAMTDGGMMKVKKDLFPKTKACISS